MAVCRLSYICIPCVLRAAFQQGEMTDDSARPAKVDYSAEDKQILCGMPQLPHGYTITEFIRKLMLRGHKAEGNDAYEAATCMAHMQHRVSVLQYHTLHLLVGLVMMHLPQTRIWPAIAT